MDLSFVTEDEKTPWNQFVASQKHSPFLQSWATGDFYLSLGNKVWRIVLRSEGKIVGVCLIVRLESRLGPFLYVPEGPVGDWLGKEEGLEEFLIKLGQDEGCHFVRLDPRRGPKLNFKKARSAPTFTQPECTLLLSLDKAIEEIKQGLSESTRYNVGLVERRGVRVEISQKLEDFSLFNKLLLETSSRHKFQLYKQKDYYQKQFAAFLKEGQAKLFLAREPEGIGEEVLAGSVVIYFGDSVTYLHAASSYKNPKLRAPYLMQWKIIESAKVGGYHWYDFWGVAATDSPRDSWAGVTAFKKSFGGEKVCYQKPLDLPLNPGYQISRLLETWRRPIKNLIKL